MSVSPLERRRLIFVTGKGGVGKTEISMAWARALAAAGRETLWIEIENPARPAGELKNLGPNLLSLNCEAGVAFEEYMALKIKVSVVAKLFARNPLIQYLSQASPGIHELVILGKIWDSVPKFDHVVVDAPATGHALALFHATRNFARLFEGGPIHRDAEAMLATFGDSRQTGIVIAALPEEMPLVESLELSAKLAKLFPENPASFVLNRCFDTECYASPSSQDSIPERKSKTAIAESDLDYIQARLRRERENLEVWVRAGVVPAFSFPWYRDPSDMVDRLREVFGK